MTLELHANQVRALRDMGIARRLLVNASLWDHARAMKEATLRVEHGDWTSEQITKVAREAMQRAGR